MSGLSTWRRHHFPRLVAEITPVRGIGTWTASAYRENDTSTVVRAPTQFALLTEAQKWADDTVHTAFGHTCALECGQWTRRMTARRSGNS
jgi:hypothetical protein